jgi:hypothetical protein
MSLEVQEAYDVLTAVLFTVNTLQVSCTGCRTQMLLHLFNTELAKYCAKNKWRLTEERTNTQHLT